MRRMIWASSLACLALLVLSGVAAAQNNLYGTLTCTAPGVAAEPDPPPAPAKTAQKQAPAQPAAPKAVAGEATVQQSCVWPEPILLSDIGSRDAQGTFHATVSGNKSQDTGDIQINMNNGEQVTMHFEGTSVLDTDGTTRAREGTFTFTNGTGVFKGIMGQGTYAGLPRASGGTTYDLQGTYELPSDMEKPPTPKPTAPQSPTAPSTPTAPSNKAKDEG